MQSKQTLLTALLLWFYFIVIGISEKQSFPGEKISLSVPQLSEEDMRSVHMPDYLKCDACLGVSHQISQRLRKAEQKKRNNRLKEYEVIEVLENTCDTAFEEYGIKQMKGVNRLSGPGLEAESVMGMTQMGGKWPFRLQEMCHNYVGETGEMEIYDAFKSGSTSDLLCHGTGLHGYCVGYDSNAADEL